MRLPRRPALPRRRQTLARTSQQRGLRARVRPASSVQADDGDRHPSTLARALACSPQNLPSSATVLGSGPDRQRKPQARSGGACGTWRG